MKLLILLVTVYFPISVFAQASNQPKYDSKAKTEGIVRNYSHTHSWEETEAYARKLAKDAGLSESQTQELLQNIEAGRDFGLRRVKIPECKVQRRSLLDPLLLSAFNPNSYKNSKENKSLLDLHLNDKVTDLTQLFNFVSTTPTGAEKLKSFLTPYQSGTLKIKLLSKDDLKARFGNDSVGSHFVAYFDFSDRTMYLNKDTELGVLGPIFVHEATHALDPNAYWGFKTCSSLFDKAKYLQNVPVVDWTDGDKKKVDDYSTCSSMVTFKTERLAYTSQFNFVSEMTSKPSCYDGYLAAHSVQGDIIRSLISSNDIISQKNLDPNVLQDYTDDKPDIPLPPNPIEKAIH